MAVASQPEFSSHWHASKSLPLPWQRLSIPFWLTLSAAWKEQRLSPVSGLHGGSWPVFEALGSSRHLKWSVPHSYLGPSPCGEVTWTDPRQPALEGDPCTSRPGLPSSSPGVFCQCHGGSPTTLAKFPYATCQCVGAQCLSERVFVEVDTCF